MSADRGSDRRGPSRERRRAALREMREELERVRQSEAKIAEAIGSMRAARGRIEELVKGVVAEDDALRDMVREELAAMDRSGGGAPRAQEGDQGPAAAGAAGLFTRPGAAVPADEPPGTPSGRGAESRPHEDHRPLRMVALASAGVLVLALVAWLAIGAFQTTENGPVVLGGDTVQRPATTPDTAPPATLPTPVDAERFFQQLPEDPSQRAAVYDALWDARSPLFAALFQRVRAATTSTPVTRALAAWEVGPLTPLQKDLLHSALVQYALRQEMGATLAIDGQILRNPCRGAACSALLNYWESRGAAQGLPPVPEDAPRNTPTLRMVEAILVLRAMEEAHATRSGPT